MSIQIGDALPVIGEEAEASTTSSRAASPGRPEARGGGVENRRTRGVRLIAGVAARLAPAMDYAPLAEEDRHTIGQVADHLKVSLRTLRFYEQAGLVRPTREGPRRYYSPSDVELLRVIVALRELDVSLGAIKAVVQRMRDLDDATVANAAVDELLVATSALNRERIDELNRLNGRIDEVRQAIGRDD